MVRDESEGGVPKAGSGAAGGSGMEDRRVQAVPAVLAVPT